MRAIETRTPLWRRTNWRLASLAAAATLMGAAPVAAQTTDPSVAPIPVFEFDSASDVRSVAVELQFTETGAVPAVTALSVDWSPLPAPGRAGNPPHFAVIVVDDADVAVETFDIWNPLWVFETDVDGSERRFVAPTATTTVAFPLTAGIDRFRLFAVAFDDTTGQETLTPLIEVDLAPTMQAFCAVEPGHPACASGPSGSAPVLTAGADQSTSEGAVVSASATFTDADAGDTHTATIDWGDGTAASAAAVSAGAVSASHVYADDGTYAVTMVVTDQDGNSDSDGLTVTVGNAPPIVDAGPDRSVDAGATLSLTANFTDAGTADTHTAVVDWGDGSTPTSLTVTETPFGPPGSTAGATGTADGSHAYATAGTFTVTVTVADDDGTTASDAFAVTVTSVDTGNSPPVALDAGPYLGAVATAIALDGSASTDPDGDALSFAWSADAGTLAGASTPTPTFTAADPGIYDVSLEVCDAAAACHAIETTVVVYDPSAGFVTGGGWISSPPGACGPGAPAGVCAGDPTGRATFGFVSKYKRGAHVPEGQTEFRFQAGALEFHSSSYEWLVVAGKDRAQFKGSGAINGVGGYQFLVTAYDGQSSQTGKADGFRIKIWSDSDVVYDNLAGMDDAISQGNTQPIGGGSIVIHTKR